MTDTITLPRSVVAGALHALDLSQALLESSKSIHHTTVLEEYKALRAALAQQAVQGERRTLYECRSCCHIYNEKVSNCDCMENESNEYNEWTAAPKGGV